MFQLFYFVANFIAQRCYLWITKFKPFQPSPTHSATESQSFRSSVNIFSLFALPKGAKKYFTWARTQSRRPCTALYIIKRNLTVSVPLLKVKTFHTKAHFEVLRKTFHTKAHFEVLHKTFHTKAHFEVLRKTFHTKAHFKVLHFSLYFTEYS
jgi:hypothetical protein